MIKVYEGNQEIEYIDNKLINLKNNITIKDGDRIITLKLVNRKLKNNNGFLENIYDITFKNTKKNVYINCLSLVYDLGYYQGGTILVGLGVKPWIKNNEYLNSTLKTWTNKQVNNFIDYIQTKTFKYLNIEK